MPKIKVKGQMVQTGEAGPSALSSCFFLNMQVPADLKISQNYLSAYNYGFYPDRSGVYRQYSFSLSHILTAGRAI